MPSLFKPHRFSPTIQEEETLMRRLVAITLAAAFALALPALSARSRSIAQADIRCTPTPRMVLACRELGGTMVPGTCECRVP